jgi:hypothetical protein
MNDNRPILLISTSVWVAGLGKYCVLTERENFELIDWQHEIDQAKEMYGQDGTDLAPSTWDVVRSKSKTMRVVIPRLANSGLAPDSVARLFHLKGIPHAVIAVPGDETADTDTLVRNFKDAITGVNSEQDALVVREFSTVKIRKISWLVPGLLVSGKYNLLAGAGDSGKSSTICFLVAGLTRGRWSNGAPKRCLIQNFEDDANAVTAPRLIVAGADMTHVAYPEQRDGKRFTAGKLIALGDLLRREKAMGRPFDFVCIDPIGRLIRGQSAKGDDDIWALAESLDNLALETGATILCSAHTRKASLNNPRRDVEMIAGSKALSDSTRSALLQIKLADGRRFLAAAKGNYTKKTALQLRPRRVQPNVDPETLEAATLCEAHALEVSEPMPFEDLEDFLVSQEGLGHNGPRCTIADLVDAVLMASAVHPLKYEAVKTTMLELSTKSMAKAVDTKLWEMNGAGIVDGIRFSRDSESKYWVYRPPGAKFHLADPNHQKHEADTPSQLRNALAKVLAQKPQEQDTRKWWSPWDD